MRCSVEGGTTQASSAFIEFGHGRRSYYLTTVSPRAAHSFLTHHSLNFRSKHRKFLSHYVADPRDGVRHSAWSATCHPSRPPYLPLLPSLRPSIFTSSSQFVPKPRACTRIQVTPSSIRTSSRSQCHSIVVRQ